MITFQASGRFQAQNVTFLCQVDSSRIVITADPRQVFPLAQAISSGLGGQDYTPANVRSTLLSRVFDLGCRPEIDGWLKRVV